MASYIKKIDEITYSIVDKDIRGFVLSLCEKEWDPIDFERYNDDLYRSVWTLEEVSLDDIVLNKEQLVSDEFQKDLQPRIQKQRDLFAEHTPIPPLILRGENLLIFDGYARYHFFREIGVKKCFAFVGRR